MRNSSPLDSFDAFLAQPLLTSSGRNVRAPENPLPPLHRARGHLSHPLAGRRTDERAKALADEACALIAPIADRTAAPDPTTLASARIALLAAAATLRAAFGDHPAIPFLLATSQSLIALEDSPTDGPAANQVILLVRVA
ncbi:hypothetical protein [Streptomyces specialis]|uniref:hypothetical protein n=1 Tax=Streptomyces specialis TaxID=498367 RepID=UPI00131B4591|nr:hypothetical protein [Streptomyces specialis]